MSICIYRIIETFFRISWKVKNKSNQSFDGDISLCLFTFRGQLRKKSRNFVRSKRLSPKWSRATNWLILVFQLPKNHQASCWFLFEFFQTFFYQNTPQKSRQQDFWCKKTRFKERNWSFNFQNFKFIVIYYISYCIAAIL